MLSSWALVVLGTTLLGASRATPAPDATVKHAAAASATATGCSSPISIPNGGFESGKIAPWTELTNSDPNAKQRIVSPGYNKSKYAVQVDLPANSGGVEYSLEVDSNGKVCWGYYYNISYSWNWVNYTGPEGGSDPNHYCVFYAITGYTDDNVPQHYGTSKPGWHHNSYIARDIYSHCKNLTTSFVTNVECVGSNPAFSIQIDNFSITTAPGNPNPPPDTGLC